MTVNFNAYVRDTAANLWRFPRVANADPVESLGVSNTNAADLLAALGLADPHAEPVPLDVFSNLVTTALRRHLGKRSPAYASVEDIQPGRMSITYCGRSEGYIERRLSELAVMTQEARAIGATHIGWG